MKIGFCFLIYDIINHEELWNYFFENVDTNQYNIYIHYKANIPLKYFEKYKLTHCIETKYRDVSLTHAHNLLFKKAYEDGCDKMITLSQSCIPLKSFDRIYHFLTKDNFGHFNITPQTQCFPRCNSLLKYYNKDIIHKSSEWFILNRTLCECILNVDKTNIDNKYKDIDCPEEHFFITTIFYNQLQNEIVTTPNLANGATTFTNWQGMDYKYPSYNALKNYSSITEEELIYLMKSPCLFGRKFNPECKFYNIYFQFIKNKSINQYINISIYLNS